MAEMFATSIPFPDIALRMVVAALAGAALGWEREKHRSAAGLRTHMLVTLAAAVFTIVTLELAALSRGGGETMQTDSLRIVEAVTAGVAFLAAGTIIFARGKVKGLTTGAGLWLSGAIGLAAGLGFWQVAALATVLAIIVLGAMHVLEKKVGRIDGRDGPPDD